MNARLVLAATASLAACGRNAPAAPAAEQLVLLERDVTLTPGSPIDLTVPVPANEELVVTVTSDHFDPVLEVAPPGAEVLTNDDYNGSRTQSQLTFHTTQPGPMRLAVSAYAQRGGGNFHVTVRKVPHQSALGTFLLPGQTERGELATGDRRLADGREYDEYMVLGPATGGAFELRLAATGSVVPLAIVLDPRGRSIAQTSPGVFPIREPLLHRVQIIATQPGAAAGYTVSVTQQGGAPAAPPPAAGPSPASPARPATAPAAPSAPAAAGAALAVPSMARDHHQLPPVLVGAPTALTGNVDGRLTAASFRLPSGEWAQVYDVDLPAERALSVDATSEEFDTYLVAVGPDGTFEENDDTNGTNAHLDLRYSVAGHVRLVVTSYQAGTGGAFVLKLAERGATQVAAATDEHTEIGAGDVTRGTLARGDRTLASGEFMDTYRQTFTAGESVHIRVESSDFDPYLIVRSPGGEQSDNDDIAPPDRAAGIDIPAAEAGQYSIGVTSYQSGETGRYTLRVTRGAGAGAAASPDRPAAAPAPSPTPSEDAPSAPRGPGESRVYGIYVGISDYPEGVGDLDECANDAIKLAEAMRDSGLQGADAQVVLTDGQATVGAVRDAFRRIGRQVGPADTFIFFHSGHGSQQEGSRDSREIDGTDESIVLHDGDLLDDEMGHLFDQIGARTAVLSLDSCFAGGFAKDVITRPGRVGFFSSEEDVESSVASQFQAGGYLSYFLRTGVSGAADNGPRDRALTVGELQHFLTVQFGRHATDVELAGAYQHLVVDRGAVRSTEVLWRYR